MGFAYPVLDKKPSPAETTPLLAKGDLEAPPAPQDPHSWDGSIIDITGGGSRAGWLSCLAGSCVPCLAFGWNVRQGLNRSLWLYALTFLGLFYGGRWLYTGAIVNADIACAPLHGPPAPPHHPPHPPHLPHGPHPPHPPHGPPHPPPPGPFAACHLISDYAHAAWAAWTQREADMLLPLLAPDEQPPARFEDLSPECHAAMGYSAGVHILVVALAVGALVWASHHRTLLRERLNIPGSKLRDVLAWYLCPLCALCQETRTLLKHRVEKGMWQGLEPQQALPVSAAPAPQLMAPKAV